MNSKITLLLTLFIILFSGSCQNNTAATAAPTPTILTTPTQPTPTYTAYHTPTRVPIQTAIHRASQAEVKAKPDWPTYSDPVSGLSFQYPPEWEIFESKPGIFVRFLHDERGHFIHFTIRENLDNLSPRE